MMRCTVADSRSALINVAAVLLALVPLGCQRSAKPSPTAATAPAAQPAGGGAVQAVRGAVQRTVSQADLHNLKLFLESASLAGGQMPDKAATLAALKSDPSARNLVELIESGDIVMPVTGKREGVWAYTKAAETGPTGGMILTNNGVERVNGPQELQQRLK